MFAFESPTGKWFLLVDAVRADHLWSYFWKCCSRCCWPDAQETCCLKQRWWPGKYLSRDSLFHVPCIVSSFDLLLGQSPCEFSCFWTINSWRTKSYVSQRKSWAMPKLPMVCFRVWKCFKCKFTDHLTRHSPCNARDDSNFLINPRDAKNTFEVLDTGDSPNPWILNLQQSGTTGWVPW